ncbi:MAG: iron-containing alcohol dehydrogenase [Chloroflexota bacterium]|jgi:alcohol dehydrogenase
MTPINSYRFLPLEKVIHGPGGVARLPEEVDRLGGRRIVIITGRSLATRTPLVDELERLLGRRHAGTFSGIQQHVPESGIVAAGRLAREVNADLLVSLGGGSPIDAAKSVARSIASESGRTLPHVALPTTLSAAEFSHMAGYTNESAGAKTGFRDPSVTPRVVILDPELTLNTPAWLWSASGIRALDHAVETLYSPGRHPVNDVLALEAIGELFACLPRAKAAPDEVETKYRCQLAAWMSFFGPAAVQYGLSHRLGRIVGATFGVAHGVTSAITLAHVMRYKAETEAPRLAPIAQKLKLADDGTPAHQAALAAADAVTKLVKQLDLPSRLRDVGVPDDALEEIAAQAAEQLGEDPAGALRVVQAAW